MAQHKYYYNQKATSNLSVTLGIPSYNLGDSSMGKRIHGLYDQILQLVNGDSIEKFKKLVLERSHI